MTARVLVVDDHPVNIEVLAGLLAPEGYIVSTAADGFEALTKIEAERPDIVLLDVMMPDVDGFEVCRRIKSDPAMAHIPVMMVTVLDHVDDLVRGFEAGANDYLTKPFKGLELLARVRLQIRQKQSYEQSLVDPLTGGFNRRYFDAQVPRLAARCRAARKPIAILVIDVDDLKQINDTYGHAAGNLALKRVVNRITSALRPSDLVMRMGGDEFVVVMPETDLEAALQIAERLRCRVGDPPIEGVGVPVSIGAATSRPDEEEELDATLQRADAALYKSKRTGGNRVSGDSGGDPSHSEISASDGFRGAIDRPRIEEPGRHVAAFLRSLMIHLLARWSARFRIPRFMRSARLPTEPLR
jgi:diguanylate cyclase (GGDEF)-like protein